jgi:glutathione S-transferase
MLSSAFPLVACTGAWPARRRGTEQAALLSPLSGQALERRRLFEAPERILDMKLYLAPGACSLADHIALHEAGLSFDCVRVDLRTKRTQDGGDFTKINPKGYVPALVLDDGQILTENIAILSWVAHRAPQLAPDGDPGRIRLLEMLAFISTEIHKTFGRILFPINDDDREAASKKVVSRLELIAGDLRSDYLFGSQFTVADAYLYVMLRWAAMKQLEIPEKLKTYIARIEARPAVQLALHHEDLA